MGLKNNLSTFFGIFLVSMLFVPPSMPSSEAQEDYTIPSWIKNNAGWWAEDQIDDSSFLQAIQYLIENGIIVVPVTEAGTESSSGVPAWIKNSAGWWADDTISDGEFMNSLQFLLKKGIIKIEQDEKIEENVSSDIPVYESKVSAINKELYKVVLVYSTQNKTCSAEEKGKAVSYGKMAEYLLNKNLRTTPTKLFAYCLELHEITGKTYSNTLLKLGLAGVKLIIYVGGLEANLDAYDIQGYVGWWSSGDNLVWDNLNKRWLRSAGVIGQIVVCDECQRAGVNMEDFEKPMDRGMWVMSSMIGANNIYEVERDTWDDEGQNWATTTSIGDNQEAFDLCLKFDMLENELCKKLYEKPKIDGKRYTVMKINYAKNNWEGEQKEVKKEIFSMAGIGSATEGFSIFTLREFDWDSAKDNPSRDVETTDILTIEYPDDWYIDYYKYDWSIRDNTSEGIYFECCDVFQADNATQRVYAQLWKDDTRKDGIQYRDRWLANVTVWFLEDIHYVSSTDEERWAGLIASDRKFCDNADIRIHGYECLNHKLLEKSIFVTDEGRKTYSITTNYDLKWPWSISGNYQSTRTEVYDGNNAWQVWSEVDVDFFEAFPEQFAHFNKSLILLNAEKPTKFDPSEAVTILTEEGIQFNGFRAWNGKFTQTTEEVNFANLANQTKISNYNVVCDADCNISLDEHLDVGEVMTKVWNGTDLELKQMNQGGQSTWDSEKQEWVIEKVDKWIYESTSLEKFQDENLHKQIWEIYVSLTPKQILEELDTFLIDTSDGYFLAYVWNCFDEVEVGCGPPDASNTEWLVSFDPLAMAPTSGDREALYDPGKVKDALEVNNLKGTIIHENAHIMSLSASQSDGDMMDWTELCDRSDDGSLDWEECDETKIRQTILQKQFVCKPNYYTTEGCFKEDSYLNLFFQKFWADIYPVEFFADDKTISHGVFYNKYYDQFVSNYASTNPVEDFAESFTAFVLWDEGMIDDYKSWCPKNITYDFGGYGVNLTDQRLFKWCDKLYADNSIWEEKIRFFYDFPELVEMRDLIRSNL